MGVGRCASAADTDKTQRRAAPLLSASEPEPGCPRPRESRCGRPFSPPNAGKTQDLEGFGISEAGANYPSSPTGRKYPSLSMARLCGARALSYLATSSPTHPVWSPATTEPPRIPPISAGLAFTRFTNQCRRCKEVSRAFEEGPLTQIHPPDNFPTFFPREDKGRLEERGADFSGFFLRL